MVVDVALSWLWDGHSMGIVRMEVSRFSLSGVHHTGLLIVEFERNGVCLLGTLLSTYLIHLFVLDFLERPRLYHSFAS